jgi:nitrous oxide reductase
MRVLKWSGFAALLVGGLASGAVMVSALAMAGSRDVAAERSLQAKQVAATISKQPAHLYLTVAVGVGDDNPAFVPTDFSVPRNAIVDVSITNFDDATALTGSFIKYAKVTGTVDDTATVTPIDVADPNGPGAGPTQVINSMDPNNVSHTFTIPELGLNVPIWPQARTTFTFRTGKSGTFHWACYDPCGGAMGAPRYMSGDLRVV